MLCFIYLFFHLFKPQNKRLVFQCKHGFKANYVADANGHVHLISYQGNRAEDSSQCRDAILTCCLACNQSTDT